MKGIDGITPASMARRFSPSQAAAIKSRVFTIRLCTDQESLDYADRVSDGFAGWFRYCLDIVARRAA